MSKYNIGQTVYERGAEWVVTDKLEWDDCTQYQLTNPLTREELWIIAPSFG